jgi:hypothetical protein
MAINAPKVRKHLSADALVGLLRTGFAAIADHRPGHPDISLTDALRSAFALFSLKSPSLLAFDQERTEGNLQQVCGITRVPCDTAMREILDPVEPDTCSGKSCIISVELVPKGAVPTGSSQMR